MLAARLSIISSQACLRINSGLRYFILISQTIYSIIQIYNNILQKFNYESTSHINTDQKQASYREKATLIVNPV
ncbi:hypothetical protein FGO68_gene3651 [Halteria grandinella]|uniref:Uncharacterized protein n=1 Tax=Halteria grandinella TaxID=5974 RepID=A0A8J8NVL6_HALGN|nr:hypothetical protein FGO68_gene3651 [Halteria grandinella]